MIERASAQAEAHRLGWLVEQARFYLRWIDLSVNPRAAAHSLERAPVYDTVSSLLMTPANVIDACGRTGELQTGRALLETMRRRYVENGFASFGAASAKIGSFLLRCGIWEEAVEVLHSGEDHAVRSHDLVLLVMVRLRLAELYPRHLLAG